MRALAAVCAACVCLASFFITANAHADAATEAVKACNSGDPDVSIKGCTTLIDGKKLNKAKKLLSVVYNARAQAYLQKKDYDRALGDASKCTELDPDSAPCWLTKALLHDQKFQHDKALDGYTRHLKLSPHDKRRCEVLLLRADAYSRKSLWDSAFDMVKNKAGKDLPKDAPPPELSPEQKKKRDKDIQAAESDMDECIALDPGNDGAYLRRGMYRNQLGRHDEGFADYAKAYEVNPNNADALSFLATNAFNRQDYPRALELTGNWMTLVPNDLSIQDLYADSLIKVGRTAEGDKLKKLVEAKRGCIKAGDPQKFQVADYEVAFAGCTAIIDAPDVEQAWRLLAHEVRGTLHVLKARDAEAIADYTRCLELSDNPKSKAIYLENRGSSYVALKQWDNAIRDLDASMAISPGTARGLDLRGGAYFNKKDYDKAEKDLKQAAALNPQNKNTYATLGDIAYFSSNYDAAIQHYSKLIELDPKFAVAYEMRGASLETLGRKDEAKADYHKALELDPKLAVSAAALKRLGDGSTAADDRTRCDTAYMALYAGTETNLDDGIASCTAVINAAGVDQQSLVNALEARGEFYSRKQNYQAAVDDLTRCLELAGGSTRASAYYQQRAFSLINLGQHERGIADLDLALKQKPDDARGIEMRGVAYFQTGQMDKAKTDFSKVVQLDPNNSNAYAGLGDIERLSKNCSAAIPHYNKMVELTSGATAFYLRAECLEELGRKDEAVADYRKSKELAPDLVESTEALKRLGAAP